MLSHANKKCNSLPHFNIKLFYIELVFCMYVDLIMHYSREPRSHLPSPDDFCTCVVYVDAFNLHRLQKSLWCECLWPFTETRFLRIDRTDAFPSTPEESYTSHNNLQWQTFILKRQRHSKVGTNETSRWSLYCLLVVRILPLEHKEIAVG